MREDFRDALRTLVKSRTYSLVGIAVLALGIGANAAIFSFVDGMLLRPLPYPHADRLYAPVSMNPSRGSDRASVSVALVACFLPARRAATDDPLLALRSE